MEDLQLGLGLLTIAVNLLAAAMGAIAWARNSASIAFWYVLRAGQAAVLLLVVAECVFYADGYRAEDGLHYLYVFLPVAVSLLAEGTRAGAARQELGETDFHSLPPDGQRQVALAIVRRETGIMAAGAGVIAFLIWRGLETTGGW